MNATHDIVRRSTGRLASQNRRHGALPWVPASVLPILVCVLSALALPTRAEAQTEKLSLRDAISIALENGDRSSIARRSVDQSEAVESPGIAGLLPSLDVTGSVDGSYVSTRQEFVNGEGSESSGALSTQYNAGIDASWTFFDGFAGWRELDRLELESEASRVQLERTEREVVADVAHTWFRLLLAQREIDAIEDAIDLSRARRDRAEDRLETGAAVPFELTQAQVDLDRDSAELMQAEIELRTARIELNRLLQRDPLRSFTVAETSDLLLPTDDKAVLLDRVRSTNSEVRARRIAVESARVARDIVDSEYWPHFDLVVGYDFTRSESDAGFLLSNRTSGLNAGLSARWNIFNGFSTGDRASAADIAIDIAERELAQSISDAESEFEILYRQYLDQQRLVEFSMKRIDAARENVQLARDRVELGAITPIEIREAQNGIVDAETALIRARYERVRIALQLMTLTGDIETLAE